MDNIGTKCGKLPEEDRIWVCRMARSDCERDYSERANNWMGTDIRSAKPLDGFNCYFMKLSKLMSEKRQLAGN
ncbi:Hypothetical protein PHPALM_6124 [Phytophthora palmivora]|uniref:Uncharacterized protein n=1 Tax=Phytophthora palmivora TaxID=4796 RepID=A0A2P4YFZ0_9STRA|nr:Hypothetical protein PHPALM_6124 [Phytophthora palmivora]